MVGIPSSQAQDSIERAANLPSFLPVRPARSSADQHWRGLQAFHFLDCRSGEGVALPRFESDLIIAPFEAMRACGLRTASFVDDRDLAPGSVAIVPRKTASRWTWRDGTEIMVLMPERLVMQELAASMTEKDPQRFELVTRLGVEAPLVHRAALELKAELESDGLHGLIYAETLIQTLCAHLVLRHSTFGTDRAAATGGLDDKRLKNAISYILAHLSEDISISAVAKAVHLSPFHFARAFKTSTGRPPHQFVIERRIERAKQMLQTTKRPVADIAVDCGFQSQSHFTILFRRRTGLTPNVYREAR